MEGLRNSVSMYYMYCKSLFINERLYFANIRKWFCSRIHSFHEILFQNCYQIFCPNMIVQMFDHWPYNIIWFHLLYFAKTWIHDCANWKICRFFKLAKCGTREFKVIYSICGKYYVSMCWILTSVLLPTNESLTLHFTVNIITSVIS